LWKASLLTIKTVGIALLGYSPVSKGWLTGQYKKYEDIPKEGYLRMYPRYQAANFDQNLKLADAVETVAKQKGVTVAQVAINWCRSQGVIPIAGWTKVERSEENCKDVPLSDKELGQIQMALDALPIVGGRYPALFEPLLNL
jgi:pyridoxine 4-dehydrogenase